MRPFDKEGANVPKGSPQGQGWLERGQMPTKPVPVDPKGWSTAKGNSNTAKVGKTK